MEKQGIKFLSLTSKSYAQVVTDDPTYFCDRELKYASAQPDLYHALPVAVVVGLRGPSELALPGSFSKSRETQLEMIEKYSQELQAQFPDCRAIMLPLTGYAQADIASYKAATGEVLFSNCFARALDNLSGVNAAFAGRNDPSDRFSVHEWGADFGGDRVRAVPAVVFIGNK